MAKFAITLISIACFIASCSGAGWVLEWEDNFDHGEPLDWRWQPETGCWGWGNNELQCYTDFRWENIRQENGLLTIEARREWWGDGQTDLPFTSARIRTKTSWLYGKIEIRARLPKGKHLWPAFWMMPAWNEYGEWPRSGEIDIMEYRGQRPTVALGTLHFGDSKWNKGMVGSPEVDFGIDFSQDFHVFAVDWSPAKIMWLMDGVVYHEENLQRNFWEGVYDHWVAPFDREFYVLLNLAVGGDFFNGEPFDPPEADGWAKNTFEIDWLRKWTWEM